MQKDSFSISYFSSFFNTFSSSAQCSSVMSLGVKMLMPLAPAAIDDSTASAISDGRSPEFSGSTTLSLLRQSCQMKMPLYNKVLRPLSDSASSLVTLPTHAAGSI